MLHLVCVATHAAEYFESLKDSCEKTGNTLTVLGWGSKWTNFSMKLLCLKEFIEKLCTSSTSSTSSTHTCSSDIICFIDAHDVVVLKSPEEILKAYEPFSGKVLFSAEDSFFGMSWLHKNIYDLVFRDIGSPKWPRDFLRINSGAFIGPAWLLKIFLQRASYKDTNDQQFWANMVQMYPKYFAVDNNFDILHTMIKSTDTIKDTVVLVHGHARKDMTKVLQKYNYKMPSVEARKQKRDGLTLRYLWKQVSSMWTCTRFQYFVIVMLGCIIYVTGLSIRTSTSHHGT